MSDLERNKTNVVAFYDMMFNQCEPAAAVEKYVGATYIQHNPHVANDTDGFKRGLAEGDMVVLHCHQTWPGGDDCAGIDIFRMDADGKVLEHWDVLQTVPGDSANPNGMF